ncbi:hypothetical protein ACUH7Y_00855 [Clostridium beijerinckii]|uniref:Uncharacterized protein n=1 Tax=Clostridium beijerinckii TaxID=1520 RepID=A0A7X9SRS1_CLOBE|nr:hypothetical protein [Clostridium beijerinckii]NMF06876.1 hypothetical protein [Clostridium beijerinckii]
MKVWDIKDYRVYQTERFGSGPFFETEEEAIKVALEMLNERITENIAYLERLQQMVEGQEWLIEDYTKKRNKLQKEAKEDGISIDDPIL